MANSGPDTNKYACLSSAANTFKRFVLMLGFLCRSQFFITCMWSRGAFPDRTASRRF